MAAQVPRQPGKLRRRRQRRVLWGEGGITRPGPPSRNRSVVSLDGGGFAEAATVRIRLKQGVPAGASPFRLQVLQTTERGKIGEGGIPAGPDPVELTVGPGESTSNSINVYPMWEEGYRNAVRLVALEIQEVSFAGSKYHELKSDDGSVTYSAPQWLDLNGDGQATTDVNTGEKNYPVAFTRNTKAQIGAKLKVPGLPAGQTIKLKATSAQGLEIPEINVTPAADGTITLPLTEASNNFANVVAFHNADDGTAFKIDWQISVGSSGWCAIGSTKHTLYITMADPIKTATGLMRETLFNLGCRNANGKGATAQAVVDAIYNDFKDRDVQKVKPSSGTVDGNGMKYWNNPPTAGFTTEGLLSSGDGRCGAWTRMFTDVLRTQGIDAQVMGFFAPGPPPQNLQADIQTHFPNYVGQVNFQGLIFVKNWTIGANPFSPTDDQGIPAQSNANPQAFFGDHFLVEYGGQLYDPSYGSNVFASHQAWEDAALDALGAYIQANPPLPNGSTFWIWKADPKGSTETVPQPITY